MDLETLKPYIAGAALAFGTYFLVQLLTQIKRPGGRLTQFGGAGGGKGGGGHRLAATTRSGWSSPPSDWTSAGTETMALWLAILGCGHDPRD